MDIAGLNQIGEKHSEKMLFVPGENDRHVKVFFVDDEVVIFGITTTAYVFWCSVTKADDLETNREIFAYIMKMERTHYLGDYWAEGIVKYGKNRMMHCYSAMLDSADEILPYRQKIAVSQHIREPESPYFDLMQYNLLTPEDAVIPKYCPRTRDYCIRVYYADNEKIIIKGIADNNFIRWLSVTKLDDIELNRRIFAFLHETVASEYGSFSELIQKTAYTYKQAESFYQAELNSADEILPQLEQARQLCRQREANPQFIQQLRSYKKKLAFVGKDPVKDYKRSRSLIEKIKKWSYLRCSDNRQVRELYHSLIEMGYAKYNSYMTEVR